MRAISLMYHDVVDGDAATSGFDGADAALYKLESTLFDHHLKTIAQAVKTKPTMILDSTIQASDETRLFLTFDDGGVSAYTHIADRLEERGWRGHFFVTTDYIGTPTFLNRTQIRELHKRGHVIGTHSCSHPLVMSAQPWETLVREWSVSMSVLSEILGEPVIIASLPGGHYSKAVARAASMAGIRYLFTSEPVTKSQVVDECTVYGRYTIQRWTTPSEAAAIAQGNLMPRLKQALIWNAKKLIKRASGQYYVKARKSLLR